MFRVHISMCTEMLPDQGNNKVHMDLSKRLCGRHGVWREHAGVNLAHRRRTRGARLPNLQVAPPAAMLVGAARDVNRERRLKHLDESRELHPIRRHRRRRVHGRRWRAAGHGQK